MDQEQLILLLATIAFLLAVGTFVFVLLKPRKHIVRYSTGEIRRVWYSKCGKPFGIERIYYQDGTLNKEKKYRDGLLDGTIYTYYQSGEVYLEEFYSDGKLVGETKVYEKDGTIRTMNDIHTRNELVQENC